MEAIIYRVRAVWQRLYRRLYLFMKWHLINRKSQWTDAEEVERDIEQDIKYLRLQLTRLRAENNDLRNRTNDLWVKCSELFHMTRDQLQMSACRYEVQEAGNKAGWLVTVNHCVFCGCGLETAAFSLERDALLYAALLQTAEYQPKHNLSCPSCYAEYEKSIALSADREEKNHVKSK